jgi:hypothetical protein
VSVDTRIGRRNTRSYDVVQQDGVELLVSRVLSPHVRNVDIDISRFLIFSSLRARLELANGQVVGR